MGMIVAKRRPTEKEDVLSLKPLRLTTGTTVAAFLIWLAGSGTPMAAQGSPCGLAVTVAPGDTLGEIALRCQTTVQAILAANPAIVDPDVIFVGQTVTMPPAAPLPAGATINVQASVPVSVTPMTPGLDAVDVGVPLVSILPISGPPGTTVEVTGSGFAPNHFVAIGVGREGAGYETVATVGTGNEGAFQYPVAIPLGAEPGEQWVVAVSPLDSIFKAVSNVFMVYLCALHGHDLAGRAQSGGDVAGRAEPARDADLCVLSVAAPLPL